MLPKEMCAIAVNCYSLESQEICLLCDFNLFYTFYKCLKFQEINDSEKNALEDQFSLAKTLSDIDAIGYIVVKLIRASNIPDKGRNTHTHTRTVHTQTHAEHTHTQYTHTHAHTRTHAQYTHNT